MKRQFKIGLPIDSEDAEKMFSNPNVLYSKKLLEERERRNDANMLAILNNKPIPYPLPEGLFEEDICPYCGQHTE